MPHTTGHYHELILPELGVVGVRASAWLVRQGGSVVEGDRLLEVTAGEVTIDLPAPSSGILVERRVAEDELLEVGQVLGVVQDTGPPAPNGF